MGASTWLIQKYGFLLIQNQRTLKPGFLGRIRDRHQHLLHPGRLTKMEPLVAIGRTVGWTYSQRGWKVGRTCSAIFFILDIPDTDQTNLQSQFYCSLSREISCTGARQPVFGFNVLEYPSINKDHQTGLQVGLGHFCNLLGISHTSI